MARRGRAAPWRALSLGQRRRLLCLAASSGDAASLDVALAHCGCSANKQVLAAAVAGGTSALQLLLQQQPPGPIRQLSAVCAAEAAAELGQLSVLTWLLEQPDYSAAVRAAASDLLRAALRGRRDAVATWLLRHQPRLVQLSHQPRLVQLSQARFLGDILELASVHGCEEALELLLSGPASAAHGLTLPLPALLYGCTADVLRGHGAAALGGYNPAALASLLSAAAASQTPDWREKVAWLLAAFGDQQPQPGTYELAWSESLQRTDARMPPDYPERLEELAARGFRLAFHGLAEAAAKQGNAPALAWLLDSRPAQLLHSGLVSAAIEGGHAPILRLLQERRARTRPPDVGVDADERMPAGAGAAASTELDRALRPLAAETSDWAVLFRQAVAAGGPLPLLRRLLLHACEAGQQRVPLDVVGLAAGGCSVEVLEWARLEVGDVAFRTALAAMEGRQLLDIATRGDWLAVAWLLEHSMGPSPSVTVADVGLLDLFWYVPGDDSKGLSSQGRLEALMALAWLRAHLSARHALGREQETDLNRLERSIGRGCFRSGVPAVPAVAAVRSRLRGGGAVGFMRWLFGGCQK
ncbi:hypothetical protein HYH02_013477 [Chlamydomonas schloesseri]|uniref:Uncharacterized protein n=1 Tax=Chlamydomonas schloesseri TaxID=2026947 RepID=A0A835T3R2_9CHLO|nr:hypothetical protein HYH02_013477 [Chlamydomonas schloesseri]|eukprot:KAG2431046.1 hypothetical protein HYH02_013477 [Chlamydomonas schloesseri]